MRIYGALLLLLSLLASPLRADVVFLKDGREIEGEVEAKGTNEYAIKTRHGTVVVARSQVERIEKRLTPEQELARREQEVAAGDADGWFALSEYALEHKLRKDQRRLLEKALAADPEHAPSHEALGHVRHAGQWMTPEAREKAIAEAEQEAMRARGLVLYQGRWVSAEAREFLERGLVEVDGKWLTPAEARAARGLTLVDGELVPQSAGEVLELVQAFAAESGIALSPYSTQHITAASPLGLEHARELAGRCEEAFGWVCEVLDQPRDLEWVGGRNVFSLVLDGREEFAAFTQFFANHERKVDRRWAQSVGRSDGFYWWDPVGTTAVRRGQRLPEHATAHSVHSIGHVFLNRIGYNFCFLPAWLDEGFAGLVEFQVMGFNSTSCLGTGGYATPQGRNTDLLPGLNWLESMSARIRAGDDPPFEPILLQDIASMEPDQAVKATAVLRYLLQEKPADFRRFFARLREVWPAGVVNHRGPEAREAHRQAFEALGIVPARIDAEVRAFYRRTGDG